MDLFEKAFKENEPIHALKNFLMVEAPDVVYKNAMYYNEKGEGLLDTFWTINPEPTKHIEGEKVYWINAQGERFNVAKTEDYVIRNKKRLAETDEDFSEIYNREFKSRNLKANSSQNNLLMNEIIEQTTTLVSHHRERLPAGKRDLKIIDLANRFISFLENKLHNNSQNDLNEFKESEEQAKWITKNELIKTIEEYEKTGLRNYDLEYSNFINRIEIECLNEKQKSHVKSVFTYKVHNQYHKIDNIYKDGLEEFKNNNGENERTEFIAKFMLQSIDWDSRNTEKINEKLNFLKNMRTFGICIPKTYTLWLLKTKLTANHNSNSAPDKTNANSKPIKSLKWLNKQDFTELNNIHIALKEHGYINCGLSYFKKSFLETKDFEKIEWLRVDSSLIYFYGRLIDKNKIKKPSNKWLKFKDVFQYSGSSAASLYSQYKNESKNLPDKSFFDSLIK